MIRELLDGDERTAGGIEAVESAMNYIQRAASLNADYESISESITDVYYNLRDCIESISDAADSVESDPQRLEEIDERLDLLNRLTKSTAANVMNYLHLPKKCRQDLKNF